MSLYPLVLGTAGHIDHGKTTLVHALTGIDTDRLPVEKARGITTELGFAHLDLGGKRLAVVDVPGHERFVKAMAAGAAGLDLVLMVIAADEGPMPQTREHLDICQLLGVRRGLVALTKRDLVDDDWLEMAIGELRPALAGSFLADAPIIPVSARTGAGLPELRAAIGQAVAALPPRDKAGVFRLPIDRIFTIKGFGTVVTGTVIGGEVAVGDELVVLPRKLAARVRGIEVHGEGVQSARAGLRAALNLGGIAVDDVIRGDVLAHPDAVPTSHILDVKLRYLPAASGPLPRRSKALIHHGATCVLATLVIDSDALAPGAEITGQIRIDASAPLAALPGDRFIARGFAPLADHGTTIGGGEIVRVLAPRSRRATDHAGEVAALTEARLAERLAIELRGAGAAGRTTTDLARRTGQPAAAITAALEAAILGGEVLAVGDLFVHGETVATVEATIVAKVAGDPVARPATAQPEPPDNDPARDVPTSRAAVRAAAPHALPPKVFDAIVAGLARRGAVVADADQLRRADGAALPRLGPLEEDLVARFRAWALEPPRPKEIPAAIGQPEPAVRTALDRLLAHKLLIKVKPDLYADAAAIATLRDRLIAFLDQHGEITAQQWKDLTGSTRKYSIPLAEYFDGEKVTLRIGEVRRRRR